MQTIIYYTDIGTQFFQNPYYLFYLMKILEISLNTGWDKRITIR